MGKEKYKTEVMDLLKKSPVVTSRDIKLIVNRIGVKQYAYLLVHNLIKNGVINKITKGFYTIHDDPTVAVFCFKPAYIGLQDALSIHGLWEQESNVVIVTARKVRSGIRGIMNSNVVVHRILPRYFFGVDMARYGDLFVPVSDLEKTLIDFFYFKENLDENVLKLIKMRIDRKRLMLYLKKYTKEFRERILAEL